MTIAIPDFSDIELQIKTHWKEHTSFVKFPDIKPQSFNYFEINQNTEDWQNHSQ